MNVLSLFDGMSCGMIALDRLGIEVNKYYASEIDKYAIKVSKANYPNVMQMGDINEWESWNIDFSKIDLILAGSPCQGFSCAGKQLNFDDPRSRLFFVFVDILDRVKKLNPNVKFLLENVKMKKDHMDKITEMLGVAPILINSSLVSAQNRERLYWFNWEAAKPEDKCLLMADVYESNSGKPLTEKTSRRPRTLKNLRKHSQKAACMTATMYKLSQSNGMTVIEDGGYLRCVTPTECERLQTVPDGYTSTVSNTQRYKMLGNGWTVDVIAHILKNIKQ